MRIFVTILVFLLTAAPVIAQGVNDAASTGSAAALEKPLADESFERRLALAEELHKLRPVADQVDRAIERYAQTRPEAQREAFIAAMKNILNYKALERLSIDAYAQIYTEAELSAMVEYYAKPEALSASKKYERYAGMIYPEIIKMLDKAAIRLRTGVSEP